MIFKRRQLKYLYNAAVSIYIMLVVWSITNGNARCRVDMPDMMTDPLFAGGTETKRCIIELDKLGPVPVDIFEKPNITTIEHDNKVVEYGGKWEPDSCTPWQHVAVIIPYRDRWDHLKLVLKRLHPLMRKQKIKYQIFVIEQAFHEKFNRGRLMNIGVKEALKVAPFDCFIFQDADLLPENDKNIYYCDNHARHLASAIDEMRYHVMYYNYAGGVLAINKDNVFRMNGYSNDYWGWGSEDDDFSARSMESGLLLTRPPEHIGRFKMVRHTKQWRAENGYDLFLTWRSRWKKDGLNSLDKSKYKVLEKNIEKLYTKILVDIGKPPEHPPIDEHSTKESLIWFLKFFFP